MTERHLNKKNILINKGVTFINPDSIVIGEEIDPDRISADGVTIYAGTKIFGEKTFIDKGSTLGFEAPATIDNCCIGPNVNLRGGYFKDSVFLENVSFGSCAQVREGCILEEYASAAHCVGIKQTILFPFVTLGSLINFCDCFLSGGTGKKDHSEVGSSYIHFNFTPQQDKATPSLIGDVPNGVMLDQLPIFLGGQGGLVGPCRLGFGITIAAGTICRKDELRSRRLIFGGEGKGGNISFSPGIYRNVKRNFINNLIYIGNLYALEQWYKYIRYQFISDSFSIEMYEGLQFTINLAINERIKRLKEFIGKLQHDSKHNKELISKWTDIETTIKSGRQIPRNDQLKDNFSDVIEKAILTTGKNYIDVIKRLEPEDRKKGTLWLQEIVEGLLNDIFSLVPGFGGDSDEQKGK